MKGNGGRGGRVGRGRGRGSGRVLFRRQERASLMLLYLATPRGARAGIIHLINLLFSIAPSLWDQSLDDFMPTWGAPACGPGHHTSGGRLDHYPTDLTRDVLPVACHSHNDYWRRVPLYMALRVGCTSVEADVWHFGEVADDDELYVGHTTASLSPNRTLRSLYVDPLVDILAQQNHRIADRFEGDGRDDYDEEPPFRGVFDADPAQTLVLLIDFKTDGATTWPHVLAQLEPLRARGFLSHWDGAADGAVVRRPVTVVATGNAPFDRVVANASYRDVFFDAPLGVMGAAAGGGSGGGGGGAAAPADRLNTGQGTTGVARLAPSAFSASNSFYASASFPRAVGHAWTGRLSAAQLRTLRAQIAGARARGLKARYWGTPGWPRGRRNRVWETIVREGGEAVVLNVDDLVGAARGVWGPMGCVVVGRLAGPT
ncbi:hypothetical protein BDY21DRAFT_386311 [Lineolata rhizophorae]|uniref:Altered inheritance of mitochondria protein 6 n=1 Tax=Lineolata rhizophorae TaxID=578093 RepID=A0A6A6NYQ6_9PEZI|nr:hypothetical protein BDY21DRAFT_386311 [Lineolata rhizophorae]